jgi:hypothetical protein
MMPVLINEELPLRNDIEIHDVSGRKIRHGSRPENA